MNRCSERALQLGEELFDYVDYGLTRNDAIQELAGIVDESNADLLQAISALLQDAQRNRGVPSAFYVEQLRRVFLTYEPRPSPPDAQGEFPGVTVTVQPRLL